MYNDTIIFDKRSNLFNSRSMLFNEDFVRMTLYHFGDVFTYRGYVFMNYIRESLGIQLTSSGQTDGYFMNDIGDKKDFIGSYEVRHNYIVITFVDVEENIHKKLDSQK